MPSLGAGPLLDLPLLGPVCLDLWMYLGPHQRPAQPAFCHSSTISPGQFNEGHVCSGRDLKDCCYIYIYSVTTVDKAHFAMVALIWTLLHSYNISPISI